MFFEAQIQDRKYQVDIVETKAAWRVAMKCDNKEWQHFEVAKTDFQKAESYTSFIYNGQSFLIDVIGHDIEYTVFTRSSFRSIKIFNDEMLLHESLKKGGGFGGDAELKAGMPGKIIEIFATPGEVVKENKPLLIMEAMKMENEMRSSREVKIKEICVKQGDSVETGQVLIKFEEV